MRARVLMLAGLLLLAVAEAAAAQALPCQMSVDYGNNDATGRTASINGIGIYYETYGSGQPLLLIHGNGGSIASMRCQIPYFADTYQVIAADSRGHGRSGNGDRRLTYEQMADDLAALLKERQAEPADVIGHSDGAIIALLLALRHPGAVAKVVASGPNLRPDSTAIAPWFLPVMEGRITEAKTMLARGDRSEDWGRIARRNELMHTEPHIRTEELQRIQVPVLLMGGDDDMVNLEHLVEIYRSLPSAQLAILPGSTHFIFRTDHDRFNAAALRFLRMPFTRPTSRQMMEKSRAADPDSLP